jgi:pimeloyl-ACP methyl ester carboxylesterase
MLTSSVRTLTCLASSVSFSGQPQRTKTWFVGLLFLLASSPLVAQLSQNSGINASDTYATFDVTFQGQATVNLSQAIYNPSTGVTSSISNLTPSARHFHVEVGYDASDQLVLNMFSTDSANPTLSPYGDISKIQMRNGKVTVFDDTGTPLPISLPNNAALPLPLSFLGAIPGSSVLNYLVVANPSTTAAAMNASVQYSGATTTRNNNIQAYYIAAGTQVQMAYVSANYASSLNATATFSYEQFAGGWALTQVAQNPVFSNTQGSLTTQFANLQWYDNATGDSRRASKAVVPPAPPQLSAASDLVPNVSGPAAKTPSLDVINLGLGSTNLLYQHGIFSDEGTWDRMDCPANTPLCITSWLRSDFLFNTIAKSNLNSKDYLTNQANSLISLLQATGKTGFLAIGHSNGSPIIRDVAFRQPSLVNRVITVDGDNNGAEMTQVSRAALASAMVDLARILKSWGGGTPLGGAIATLGNAMIAGIPAISVAAFDAAVPVTSDMQPGSAYMTSLNGRNETFTRVGIEGASRWRFVEWRALGDAICYPESSCGGRAFYNYANGVYYGLRTCELLAWIFGDYELAIICDFTAFLMDYMDVFWYVFTSFNDTSDGIVQGSGQFYNRATKNYTISNADSHMGATKSDKVRAQLDYTLQHDFGLTPRWCMTASVSPGTISPSYLGGTYSSYLSVTSGCPWTAVSSAPWITITAGFSGTASATISFSSELNLSTTPRTGTITITGLQTNLSVTVTQAGLPASVATGSVAITGIEQSVVTSSTGSTGTLAINWYPYQFTYSGNITVYLSGTQIAYANFSSGEPGYPVAQAISNQINANSSAPVTSYWTNNSYLGVVYLTSKTTGSNTNYPLTISCHVASGSACSYVSASGMSGGTTTTLYDAGTIWITVNAVQTSVSYGQTSTPSTIAWAMAAKINSTTGSYVQAGVIGTAVWLVSKATQGANYPYSSGTTYDSAHFALPSFTTTDSGLTLTGSP